MTLLRIVAHPLHDPARGVPADVWRAETEGGAVLVARTRTPFFDGARALRALGHPAEVLVTLRIAGSRIDSFVPVALGRVSELTVIERDSASARFARWRPLPDLPQRVTRGAELSASGIPEAPGAPGRVRWPL